MLNRPLKFLMHIIVVITMMLSPIYSELASAADPVPGDACTVNNSRIRSGGPATSGIVYEMICQGGVWVATKTYLANSRVGIGTAGPNYVFEVQGTNTSLRNAVVNTDSTVARTPGFKAVNYMGAAASGFSTIDINNSRGTIGSPTAMLSGDYLGAIAFTGARDTSGNQNQGAVISAITSENFSASASGSDLLFSTTPLGSASVVERMRITSSGLVGIGTSSPGNRIHGRIADAATTTITNMLQLEHESTGTPAAGFGSGLLFTGESTTTTNRDMAQISSVWTTATDASRASALTFSTLTGGGALSEKVRIDGLGRVGIGTTAPNSLLHLTGGNLLLTSSNDNPVWPPEISFYRSRGTLTARTVVQAGDEIGKIWFYGYNGSAYGQAAGIQVETTENWTGASQGTLMRFLTTDSGSTTAANRMIILQSGDTGIGTTSPTARLEVANGNIVNSVNSNTASTGPGLFGRRSRNTSTSPLAVQASDDIGEAWFNGYDGTGYWEGGGYYINPTETWTSTSHGAEILFDTVATGTTSTWDRMIIASNGYVGIGTNNPGYPLEVLGGNIRNIVNSNTSTVGAYVNHYRSRGTASAPTAILAGDVISDPWAWGHNGTSIGDAGGIQMNASENWITTSHGSNLFLFTTSSGATTATNRVIIQANGNVGMGVMNPSHILQINGQGRATNINWATTSDIRLKDIQGDYQYGLDEILKLHTVWFNYKKDNPLKLPSDQKYSGVIAQELKEVIPEAVEKSSDGYFTVNSDPVRWAVINAIQEMWKALSKNISLDQEQGIKLQSLRNENAERKAYLCQKDPSAPFCKSTL